MRGQAVGELQLEMMPLGVGGRGWDEPDLVTERIVFLRRAFQLLQHAVGFGFLIGRFSLHLFQPQRGRFDAFLQPVPFTVHPVNVLHRDPLSVDGLLQIRLLLFRFLQLGFRPIEFVGQELDLGFILGHFAFNACVVLLEFPNIVLEDFEMLLQLGNIGQPLLGFGNLLAERRMFGFQDLQFFRIPLITTLELGGHGFDMRHQ